MHFYQQILQHTSHQHGNKQCRHVHGIASDRADDYHLHNRPLHASLDRHSRQAGRLSRNNATAAYPLTHPPHDLHVTRRLSASITRIWRVTRHARRVIEPLAVARQPLPSRDGLRRVCRWTCARFCFDGAGVALRCDRRPGICRQPKQVSLLQQQAPAPARAGMALVISGVTSLQEHPDVPRRDLHQTVGQWLSANVVTSRWPDLSAVPACETDDRGCIVAGYPYAGIRSSLLWTEWGRRRYFAAHVLCRSTPR